MSWTPHPPKSPPDPCLPSLDGVAPSKLYRRAVEDKLKCIAECAGRVHSFCEYQGKENSVISLFQPLGHALIPDFGRPVSRGMSAEVKLNYFNVLVLETWRRRISALGIAVPEFDILEGLKGNGSLFDPSKGDFVDWVIYRFPLRLKDYIGFEEHDVRRSQKTESRRRNICGQAGSEAADPWGYRRLSALDGNALVLSDAWERDWEQAEAKIELNHLLESLPEKDRLFLQPYLGGDILNSRELAKHWSISPAAVSKRLRRIRDRLARIYR